MLPEFNTGQHEYLIICIPDQEYTLFFWSRSNYEEPESTNIRE